MSAIQITALSSVSALGGDTTTIRKAYDNERHYLTEMESGEELSWVGQLPQGESDAAEALRGSDTRFKGLDDTVLFAMLTARRAIKKAKWQRGDHFGINIGSSRGATALFERYYHQFLDTGTVPTATSPTTTMGNIASWVAHDLQCQGPAISHSITCSTALHALLNGVAWLQSGMCNKFLVGGSEAALTAFTIAQMRALKIYSRKKEDPYPCRALDLKKTENTMVLGEGAAMICLEKGFKKDALATIDGIGYATEPLVHGVSISSDAHCFQTAMAMAVKSASLNTVDAIVMHAPGTIKGDLSEYRAIEKTFGDYLPYLTTNKWKLGHTFGASGALSLEMAVLMLQGMASPTIPYLTERSKPKSFKNIMVNAVGFGGNAVSVILSKGNT